MFRIAFKLLLLVWLLVTGGVMSTQTEDKATEFSRTKRYLTFTYNSAVGMILAFAVPVEIPNRDVLFTYNFEANYNLPTNITMYNLTPPSSRNLATVLNRTYIYNRLEEYINSFGSSGRQCILRMICDVAKSSLHHNGLLGSIFDVLFTPSTSLDEGLEEELKAEQEGYKEITDCENKYGSCPHNLIDAISAFH